jgi:hypothetical protein
MLPPLQRYITVFTVYKLFGALLYQICVYPERKRPQNQVLGRLSQGTSAETAAPLHRAAHAFG